MRIYIYIYIFVYFCFSFIGFHRRWNDSFDRQHPSIWIFIRKLKDEEKLTRIAVQAVRHGDVPAPRKLKWRRFEDRIARLKAHYNIGARTADQYWNAVAATVRSFQ